MENIPRLLWNVFSFRLFCFVKLEIWGQAQVTAQAILKIRQLLLEYTSVLKCQAAVCNCLSTAVLWAHAVVPSLLKLVSTRTAWKMALKSSPVNPAGSIPKVQAQLLFFREIQARDPLFSCDHPKQLPTDAAEWGEGPLRPLAAVPGGAHRPPTPR